MRTRIPTVDIVVPCYNYARYLPTCVRSILAQKGVSVRALIIDDASSDNTAEVGSGLAREDPRVTFRRHVVNQGHISTYNEGLLGWADSDYVVLLSADDMLAPGALKRATGLMEADDRVGMVYGTGICFEREDDVRISPEKPWSYSRCNGKDWISVVCEGGSNVISSPEVVVRGSVHRAVGGYRPDLPHAGDLEMWLRIAAVSDVGYVHGATQAYYRVHPNSMQRTTYAEYLSDLRQRKDAFDTFFREHDNAAGEWDQPRRLANRALAREALRVASRAYDKNKVSETRVPELLDFVSNVYPAPNSLPEYRALVRRRWFGPAVCHYGQLFALTALWWRLQRNLRRRRARAFPWTSVPAKQPIPGSRRQGAPAL